MEKLDKIVFSDIIKDCEYSLEAILKLADLNSSQLSTENVLNLFFLMKNETKHGDKLKVVRLLEQVVCQQMFVSRVFQELIPELVPFIEKFYSIMPRFVEELTTFLNGQERIFSNTVVLAGLAGNLEKEPSWY